MFPQNGNQGCFERLVEFILDSTHAALQLLIAIFEDVHYAPTQEAKAKKKDLRARWKSLSSAEENPKWHGLVQRVKSEWAMFERVLKEDEDLKAAKGAKEKFGEDLKSGLRERVEEVFEEITWFWQDLFKVYLPNVLGQLKELPIPRYVWFHPLIFGLTMVVGPSIRMMSLNSCLRTWIYHD